MGKLSKSTSSILLVLFFLFSPHQALRGEVVEDVRFGPWCQPRHCLVIMKLQGEITAADYEKLKGLIERSHREAESKNKDWAGVHLYLDSPGGNVDAAMAIGRLLRKEHASVRLGYQPLHTEGICYSACVLVLAGAVSRNMQDGKVGIHRPYFEVPKDEVSPEKYTEYFRKMLEELRSYFREMNVNEQLADAMLRTEPEHMRVLSSAELNNYGLTGIDPAAREISELNKAQKLGLTRQEYMRRKALAATHCANESTTCYQQILSTGKVDPSVSPTDVDFSQFGRPQ
jgi:hypothetical protein